MWSLRSLSVLLCSVVLLCSSSMDIVSGGGNSSSTWLTRNGDKPVVIASGGFSGMYPACSEYAYSLAMSYSLPNSLVSCDVHLTKDGYGICFPNINLQNASIAPDAYKNRQRTYNVNGKSTTGWFSLDFKLDELRKNVFLAQGIYSRTPIFDGQNMTTVDDVLNLQPAGVWLSVPYAEFYSQHNLNMTEFVRNVSQSSIIVKYISSPEVAFLKNISLYKLQNQPKLVFQFLGVDEVEPSTNKTYGDLKNELGYIKGFANGILVPKEYIRPMNSSKYLTGPDRNLVSDAHGIGLDVFASGFANDDIYEFAYDYSYDPLVEYLGFFDNGRFAKDGVLSDFPNTPSAAIDCFAGIGKNDDDRVNFVVISNEGASGDLPGSTDAAYNKAVSDGANVIDCSVQMTKDLILFCMGSYNLSERIDSTINPSTRGRVFAYNLTWNEIQALTPTVYNPYANNYIMFRNPRGNGVGKFMKLDEFLGYAEKQSSLSGVLISIEDSPYQAKHMSLTDAVSKTLTKTGYNKKVMIRSSEPAVLKYFQNNNKYEKVYVIDKNVSHVTQLSNSTISYISTFASSVVLSKNSLFPLNRHLFINTETKIVSQLKANGLSVYVQLFRNEFISQAWNYLSDATVEINTHVSMGINGIITDFPATAARYKKNRCLGMKPRPSYMTPVWPPNPS